MKKTILILFALVLTLRSMAQEKYVIVAKEAIGKQQFDEAKENIDKAMASPDWKDKPKTLLVKAYIYTELMKSEKYKGSSPYKEGGQALFKLIETKPEYEKDNVDQLLFALGYYYFNDGVTAYNNKKLSEATESMKMVMKICDLKRFGKLRPVDQKVADTMAANSYQIVATSMYYMGKYSDAIPLLVNVKNNPISKSPSIYECLIDAYNKQKNTEQAKAMIEEARKLYPNDPTIKNYEMNYYSSSGNLDEGVKKLEDLAAKDPGNADLQFNIAVKYFDMANPAGGKKPANRVELMTKAEEAYQRALKLNPKDPGFNFNVAAFYYNQGADYNNQMNEINGNTDADQKKYDGLKSQRDDLFAKSAQYFEAAYEQFSQKEKDLSDSDKRDYKQTVLALKEIYAGLKKMDKSAEMKKKYDSM